MLQFISSRLCVTIVVFSVLFCDVLHDFLLCHSFIPTIRIICF